MAEIIPVQLHHEMEVIVENVSLVLDEYSAACRKHPKFCDRITTALPLYWKRVEKEMKLRNSHSPFCADNILMEEIGEALNAFLSGDKQHAKQELAQCAAVILRIKMDDTEVVCPECGAEFYLDDGGEIFLDAEGAAERLLTKYLGRHPSVGDVQRLKEHISEILVSEFGISAGKL